MVSLPGAGEDWKWQFLRQDRAGGKFLERALQGNVLEATFIQSGNISYSCFFTYFTVKNWYYCEKLILPTDKWSKRMPLVTGESCSKRDNRREGKQGVKPEMTISWGRTRRTFARRGRRGKKERRWWWGSWRRERSGRERMRREDKSTLIFQSTTVSSIWNNECHQWQFGWSWLVSSSQRWRIRPAAIPITNTGNLHSQKRYWLEFAV